jgi:hypothetical protein
MGGDVLGRGAEAFSGAAGAPLRRDMVAFFSCLQRRIGAGKKVRGGMGVSKFWAGSRSFVVRRVCSERELCHKAVTCRPGFLSTSGLPTSCFWPSQHVMCLADAWAPG